MGPRLSNRNWRALFAGVALVVMAVPAAAQSQQPPAERPQPSKGRWQVEGFGGLSLFDLPSDGTFSLPPAGPPILTSGPLSQSRRVPTWFLGDGALLLNGVNGEFGVPGRIAPLDTALSTLGLSGSNAPAFGIRVRRIISTRLAIEFSADFMPGSREVSSDLRDAVEAARASFVTAFTGLLATGPFSAASITATGAVSNGSSRDLSTTLAAQWAFPMSSMEPYVTIGGGFVHGLGTLPSATLTGNYRFTLPGGAPINETDALRVRYDQGTALVGVAGAGVRRALGDRYGFALDARVLLGQQTLTMRLDSTPAVATGSPTGFVESFTTPGIQFSNSPSTGRASTLSGEPLNGFKAFSTNGLQVRYVVTAGVFIRF